jgi:hypothetical protein
VILSRLKPAMTLDLVGVASATVSTMALFTRESPGAGNTFTPSVHTTGPWRPDAQHGGPPSALLGYATEQILEPDETIARITIELVRPVPTERLLINAQRTRSSRRVAGINATLVHDGGIVARSAALVLRGSHLPKPRWSPERDQAWAVPSPDSVIQPPSFVHGDGGITYHQHAVEHRMTHGGFGEAGPGTSWVSLLMPLIDGEETSGLCALLAAADFGSGISAVYESDDGVGLINADVSIALARPPLGPWIRVESETTVGPGTGLGLAVAELGDHLGPVGVATQSLLGITF